VIGLRCLASAHDLGTVSGMAEVGGGRTALGGGMAIRDIAARDVRWLAVAGGAGGSAR
jgi:hypothetical protein